MARKDASKSAPKDVLKEVPRGAARGEVRGEARTKSLQRPLLRAALAASIGLSIVVGIAVLGWQAAAMLGPNDRYSLQLEALEFACPAHVDRATFLAEVRYIGNLSDDFNPSKPESVLMLRRALEQHPWVEFVASEGVLTIDGRYRWTILFREPILLVECLDSTIPLTVDRMGRLLPVHRPNPQLSRLIGPVAAPNVASGAVWDNPKVVRAAELAALYQAQSIESTATGWRVTQHDGTRLIVER